MDITQYLNDIIVTAGRYQECTSLSPQTRLFHEKDFWIFCMKGTMHVEIQLQKGNFYSIFSVEAICRYILVLTIENVGEDNKEHLCAII